MEPASRLSYRKSTINAYQQRQLNSTYNIQGNTMHPINVTDETFEQEVLKSDQLTVVDFWAPWCGPCRMIAPVIEELASEYAGRVKFTKLNTDDNFATSERYGIRGIPTVGLFFKGHLVDSVVGAVPKQMLKESIDRRITVH
jgi:thioredoxin 1